MKFLQFISNYESYLVTFNQRLREAHGSWDDAQRMYYHDGFLMPHYLSAAFSELGHEANSIVFNNPVTQQIWAQTHSSNKVRSELDILVEQVDFYQPDILYIMDPITLDSAFVRRLNRRPSVVIGWRAAPIHPQIDFSAFDFIFSSVPALFEQMKYQGAKRPTYFLPGVDTVYLGGLTRQEKRFEISFSGQYGPFHGNRNRLLLELSQQQLQQRERFELAYFLATGDMLAIPAGVFAHIHPPVWGRSMLDMYAASKATFHIPIDMADTNSTAMRLFEVAGVGTPLFLHSSSNVYGIFSEDEVIRFSSAQDLIEKFLKLRRESGRLEEIGALGQRKCIAEHNSVIRSKQLLSICGGA